MKKSGVAGHKGRWSVGDKTAGGRGAKESCPGLHTTTTTRDLLDTVRRCSFYPQRNYGLASLYV